ncbi:MAG: transposase [Candidatus Hydrogenedentes bacterium]|nr:transposase [Candidatus Hydrogenedentota bacterium]
MKNWQSQAYVKWECLYHVVIVPKYRRKVFFGKSRKKIGDILRHLCRHKDVGPFLRETVSPGRTARAWLNVLWRPGETKYRRRSEQPVVTFAGQDAITRG